MQKKGWRHSKKSGKPNLAMSDRGQVIVTGASKGIGAAIARVLQDKGFAVASLSRSGDAAAGENFICDVTNEGEVRQTFAEIAANGPVVGLVNNAGVHIGSPTARLNTAEFETVMKLNSTAVMVCAREAYPYLRATGGIIVNMGSFFDRMGVPHNLAYCASKAAVAAMTRCLAVEWARDDIQVVNVAPGYVETELNESFLKQEKNRAFLQSRVPVEGRAGTTEEVARLVTNLFCEPIPYLTGETIYMDGAQGINH